MGLYYIDLSAPNKTNLFHTILKPTLMYGVQCIKITEQNIHDLNFPQSLVVKRFEVSSSYLVIVLSCVTQYIITINVYSCNSCISVQYGLLQHTMLNQ